MKEAMTMTIAEGKVNENYLITGIDTKEAITRRLLSLGLTEGTSLEIMNRKRNNTLIVKVRGTRWAIGEEIAKGIKVAPREETNETD
jgi:ferrous iron transport protein A